MSSGVNKLAIFASGAGSNADKICHYFKDHSQIQVTLIITNKPHAGVLEVATTHQIERIIILKSEWRYGDLILPVFEEKGITHIILAGFLLLVPEWLIDAFRGRIINIHPALLPNYGGKGMYGMRVHQRVREAGELMTGITIHEVDEHYDEGDIVFQKEVRIDEADSAEVIAKKVLELEHYHYPGVVESWILGESENVRQ